jgi:hypothetical protein
MDKKDIITFFQEMRQFFSEHGGGVVSPPQQVPSSRSTVSKSVEKERVERMENQMEQLFEHCEVSKLDIRRMYRYLDKNVKKESVVLSLDNMDDETDDE